MWSALCRKAPLQQPTARKYPLRQDSDNRGDHCGFQCRWSTNRFLFGCLVVSLVANGIRIMRKWSSDGSYDLLIDSSLDSNPRIWDEGLSDEELDIERIWRFKVQRNEFKMPPSFRVMEATECALPRPIGACNLGPNERIHIVFVSAMWQRDASTKLETFNIIKSIIPQTRCKLWFHFMVVGHPEVGIIRSMMKKMGAWNIMPLQRKDINPLPEMGNSSSGTFHGYLNKSIPTEAAMLYSLHNIPINWVIERSKWLGLYPFGHHAGAPGMSKFFMADILWQVKRAVYLDVDMLMAGDVQDLWNYTRQFDADKKLMYYMSNNHPEGLHPAWYLRPYCSCQMVLDLGRMREMNLTKMIVAELRGRAIKSLDVYVEDGDQFLFMWVCKQYKGACKILPWMWNVSGCSKPAPFLGLKWRGKRVNGSCWRVVHFNCFAHRKVKNGKYPVPKGWKNAFQWVHRLKSKELRQRDGSRVWKKAKLAAAIRGSLRLPV